MPFFFFFFLESSLTKRVKAKRGHVCGCVCVYHTSYGAKPHPLVSQPPIGMGQFFHKGIGQFEEGKNAKSPKSSSILTRDGLIQIFVADFCKALNYYYQFLLFPISL